MLFAGFLGRVATIFIESIRHPLRSSYLPKRGENSLPTIDNSVRSAFIAIENQPKSESDAERLIHLQSEVQRLKEKNDELRREEISPRFKLIFNAVVVFTIVFFVAGVVLALVLNKPTENQQEVISNCMNLSQWGFATIIGLIGGKAL